MGEWKECKLGDLIQSISETYKFTDKKVIFLNTSDIYLGNIINKNEFEPSTLPGQAKKKIQKNDLLFSEIRPANGRYALVKDDVENYVVSTKLMVLRSMGDILPDYLNIFLTSKDMLEYLQMLAEDRSGTFPQITFNHISSINISLPSLKEQKAIAEVLSSLDDKIDLLHRQNKTLEALAQTLFRQWFIEEAKDEWEITTLGGLGKAITGKTPSTKNSDYWGDEIPFITPTDFKYYGKYSTCSDRSLSIAGMEKVKNSVLPKDSILVTCIGSDMGKVVIAQNQCVTNQQINSLIINDPLTLEYVYQHLKYSYPLLRAIAMGGTTMPIINKTDFENIEISLPTNDLIQKFHNITSPFNEKIIQNTKQIKALENMRDTLLSKLMSGEVRVKL